MRLDKLLSISTTSLLIRIAAQVSQIRPTPQINGNNIESLYLYTMYCQSVDLRHVQERLIDRMDQSFSDTFITIPCIEIGSISAYTYTSSPKADMSR